MVAKLSPEAAGLARQVTLQALEGLDPKSTEAQSKLQAAQKTLASNHGIEISCDQLAVIGADLAPTPHSALVAEIQTRTGKPFAEVKANVGKGLGAALERLRSSADGLPTHLGEILSPISYHMVQGKRLKDAKLLWTNTDLLVESGIATPGQANNPDFKKLILDSFAFSIPRPGEDDHMFEDGPAKTFGADYQGGEGNWGTLGSGRAMSAGDWQIKGGGDTGLSLKTGSKIGGLDLTTGISEAILGEINRHELPSGGNRILALIATGTFSETADGRQIPRILAVRQDPLRPSKFMLGELDRVFDPDSERAKANIANVGKALQGPGATEEANTPEKVKEGASQYVERTAQQYATAYVKRLYHGATSPSNAQMDGGWLDYDLQTAQPGHGKINVLYSEAAFGENHALKKLNVEDFLHDIFDNTPGLEGTDVQPYLHKFDTVFQHTVQREMLTLTGAPESIARNLYDAQDDAGLGAMMKVVAQVPLDGNRRPINIDMDATGKQAMPERTSEHDLGAIMVALAKCKEKSSPTKLSQAITEHLPDPLLRARLVGAYSNFMRNVNKAAEAENIPVKGLHNLIVKGAQLKNEPMTGVYRPVLRENIGKAIESFVDSGDASHIAEMIDSTITGNRRTMPSQDPFQLVLNSRYDDDGQRVITVFDARKNAERTEIAHEDR